MTRTFIRQDTQIYSSDLYDDTVVPSLANYETAPLTAEDDLNSIRSMLRHLLSISTGNWYDQVGTPGTLETGTQRGVTALNDALHLVEKKRVLRQVYNLVDVTVPAAAFATGSIVTDVQANYTDAQTFTLVDASGQTVIFEFDTVPNGVGGGNVAIDISAAVTADNVRDAIITAINGVGAGLLVTASIGGAATVTLTQDNAGSLGNTTISTTGTPPGTFTSFTGGAGDVSILAAPALPSQTIAAVGAVTTLGTVVAAHGGTFGTHSLVEVTGTNPISPKNLLQIVNGSTRDQILSGGRVIYGLLQSENVADGHTITATTPDRVQISFVRLTPTGDDLEAVPVTDIAGLVVNYASVERVRLEGLNEADFLNGAVVDVPASTTVTRQVAYDNQGTTPVDLLTNATLDLEAPGIAWVVRDDLEALLFRVLEGSAGGTSEIQFGTDVDVFNNDAVVNDFASGLRAATGTQRIDVGVTPGTIESTGANDLRLYGSNELYLDDLNQTGSTWAQTSGIKLSDTTTEWNDFETRFGEVSLLRALYEAGRRARVQSVVVVGAIVADNDVNGPITANNLNVNLLPYDTVNFLTDVDVFVNGQLLRNGANAAADEDVYPGTSPADGDLRFEFTLNGGAKPDVITQIVHYS